MLLICNLYNFRIFITLLMLTFLTACGGSGTETPNIPDTTPPVITLNGESSITLLLNEIYSELGASAIDNRDSTVEVVVSGTVDTSTLGSYTIMYTATDRANNSSSTIRTVEVVIPPDTTAPIITLNGDSNITMYINETYSELGASAIDDRDSTVEVIISGTVDTSTLGSYTVFYTATDSANNTSSQTRTVEVVQPPDITAPVITLNGESSITLLLNEIYSELGASAIDDRDGTVEVNISGTVDTSTLGSYTVFYTGTDSANNTSSQTRTVEVVQPPDITAPVITLNGESSITLLLNEIYSELGASAIDNRDGTVEVVVSGTVDTSTLGSYIITYTATDNANNTSSITRTIEVVPPKPFITTWKTDEDGSTGDNTILISTREAGYDYLVDWGDGSVDEHVSGDITHTYATAGTYTI